MEERHPFKIKNMSKAFIKEFWKDKKMIGSILPSSKFLAAKMLNHIPLENTKLIIELGPGTGIFTQKIIEKIDASTHLIVLELNPELCKDLKAKINLPNVPTAGGITTLTSQSVNLGVTPERLIVAARKQVANYNCNEPDIYLPLQSVSVNYDNQSNLLSNCSVDQYFNMTRESGYYVDYPTFSGKVLGFAETSGTLNILPTTCFEYIFDNKF